MTNVGLVRTNNEDGCFEGETMLAVADGVGGAPAGEVAAGLAVGTLVAAVARGLGVADAFSVATDAVVAAGATSSLLSGMCCTLTAAVAGPGDDEVTIAHVGDSAAWLVRGGEARRLTEDQTIAARLHREGEITADQAAVHPRRATLYQAIGRVTGDEVDVDLVELTVEPGDRLVLATDGLDYAGDDDAVTKLVAQPGSPGELADALIAAALAGGGRDNVTVVVADIL